MPDPVRSHVSRDKFFGELDRIPGIDLGSYLAGEAGALERAADQLGRACREVGFFFISDHGVPQALVDRVFETSEEFFARPVEEKLKLKINSDNIGYLPMGGNISRASMLRNNRKPNLNESFIIKRDRGPDHPDVIAKKPFRGMNQWPEGMPDFRAALVAYTNALEALGKRMLPLYAVALGMPADYFNEHPAFSGEPQISLRVAHYPPQPEFDGEEFGSAPHTDGGFMTILAQATVPGLEVQLRSGEWVKAPAIPGTFLVNTGDMLTRWTNGVLPATPHRVVNASGVDRMSIPFFFDPNTEALVECLPTCVSPDNPPRYDAITYGEYYGAFIAKNYFHIQEQQKAAVG